MPSAQILDMLDSVEDAVDWFNNNSSPDLIFMDIQLADGLSFSIFKKVEVDAPVIFTTAFDQYTLQAFKVNSVDYLLKPIDEVDLQKAVDKYQQIYGANTTFNQASLVKVINSLQHKENFRQRFLIIFAYFNHRLKLELRPESKVEAIVSRERVKDFKAWLDR